MSSYVKNFISCFLRATSGFYISYSNVRKQRDLEEKGYYFSHKKFGIL